MKLKDMQCKRWSLHNSILRSVSQSSVIVAMQTSLMKLQSKTCSELKNEPTGSSQVTRSKRASACGQTVLPTRANSQDNHSIAWPPPRHHLTITKQLGSSRPKWPNGGKRSSSWAKIWAWSNSSQLDPTESSGWPNETQWNGAKTLHSQRKKKWEEK